MRHRYLTGSVRFITLITLLLYIPCTPTEAADMSSYWVKFRLAVINGEVEKVASMSRFPFCVGGILDSDPVTCYTRHEFPKIFVRLLNQNVVHFSGERVIAKTMREVIKEKPSISAKDYNTPNMVSVEVLEFKNINGKWLLTGGYVEDD